VLVVWSVVQIQGSTAHETPKRVVEGFTSSNEERGCRGESRKVTTKVNAKKEVKVE